MSTLYVFGAGASREATKSQPLPLPLAADFFKGTYVTQRWPQTNTRSNPFRRKFQDSDLASVLTQYFGFSYEVAKDDGIVADSEVNVEEVFSFLDHTARLYYADIYDGHRFEFARRELLHYIESIIVYLGWHGDSGNLYGRIARQLQSDDSIITFNWDTILDDELDQTTVGSSFVENSITFIEGRAFVPNYIERLQRENGTHLRWGYEYHHRWARNDVRFLKLHGSVNYRRCTNSACPEANRLFWCTITVEPNEHAICSGCAGPLTTAIMPPNANKNYSAESVWRVQASMAHLLVSRANRIVFIGYSFPDFDFEARTLFRLARMEWDLSKDMDGNLEEVWVVNHAVDKAEFRDKFVSLFLDASYREAYGHELSFRWFASVEDYFAEVDFAWVPVS